MHDFLPNDFKSKMEKLQDAYTKEKLETTHFHHTYSESQDYPIVHEYWSKTTTYDEQQWTAFFKKLSKYKSVPSGVHHSLFDCRRVSILWNEVTGWQDSKRSQAFLICNPNRNQNDLTKINLFLFCLIKLNSAKFARLEYPQDFPHERPSVLNHFKITKRWFTKLNLGPASILDSFLISSNMLIRV
ncbi:unnamed protein product [Ambrosiozyma monospora]|uniref:Unnamed protein product n=1 Tax=Ambrosiozyma monospora TaxID=43982 RepID=A0ACB5SSI8_AMBMO|nr:unnamed protein product [Ambrosiozyma monospora]